LKHNDTLDTLTHFFI